MEPTDLMCATEIAEWLDVLPSAVSNWQKRNVGFPQPWGIWKSGALWLREDIKAWAAERAADREQRRERQVQWHEAALVRLREPLEG